MKDYMYMVNNDGKVRYMIFLDALHDRSLSRVLYILNPQLQCLPSHANLCITF